ncbi:MAG TPA: MFS transporter [Rectinemataceae bacterium]|nr:MFS transporter [Rectinemataceae bacterium]
MSATVNPKRMLPWIVYLIFFSVLNETVFNVSTPKIAEQFGLTPAGVSWMMTTFLVFFGVGSMIYGKLSDIFSLRSLIIVGILIYNLGSLLGFALRFSYPLVIAARAVQGMGASAIPALVFVLVARYFTPEERGRVFGFIMSTVSFGIGLGPVLGGFVSSSLHWSYLFLVPTFILISLPFFARGLPREARRDGSLDLLGAALVAVTVGLLVLYLNIGGWYYGAAFALFLVAFILRVRSVPEPFIQPRLFANAKFRNGVIVGFSLFSVVIGILFLIPFMLHALFGLTTSQIGLVLFPGAMSSVVFGPIGGNLADRRGNSFVVALGLGILVTSMIALALFLSLSPVFVAAALVLTYIGFSLFQTAMANSVSQSLPQDETGVGMGLFNLVGIISGAVGTALVGKILAGDWLGFPVLTRAIPPSAYSYSNILLLFSVVAVGGGALFLRSYREPAPVFEECLAIACD